MVSFFVFFFFVVVVVVVVFKIDSRNRQCACCTSCDIFIEFVNLCFIFCIHSFSRTTINPDCCCYPTYQSTVLGLSTKLHQLSVEC